mgnify:CR=1 FL=1
MSTATDTSKRSFRLPKITFATVGSNGMLIIYAIIVLLPLFIVVTNTMRPTREIYKEPVALPETINFDSYVIAWNEADFSRYFVNSLVITVASVVLGTSVSALAAYILGRYNFPGGRFLSAFFVAGLTLPFRLAIVPLFLLLNSLGLIDNRIGLILVYAATGIPFSVFILASFFRQLPQELTEAARIDGAQEFTIFGRVMLPLVRPALA